MMDFGQALAASFVLFCVLPLVSLLVLVFVLVFWGRRQFERFVEPDAAKLYERYTLLYNQHPDVPLEKHVGSIIHTQAMQAGLVGALTGLGGFVTLPIALPLDLLLSTRIQSSMVQFIAQTYGYSPNQQDNQAMTYAILAGSERITNMSISFLVRLAVRVLGKSLSKFIPLIGAVISFAVNYALTQSTARLAMHWYAQRQKRLG